MSNIFLGPVKNIHLQMYSKYFMATQSIFGVTVIP